MAEPIDGPTDEPSDGSASGPADPTDASGVPADTGTGQNALRRTLFVVLVALVVAALAWALAGFVLARAPQADVLLRFVRLKAFVSTFTLVVLLGLVANYVALYRELPNEFTLSLLLFTVALLLYALSANPVLYIVIGVRRGLLAAGLGGFTVLPDLFAAVAVVILLYQSNR